MTYFDVPARPVICRSCGALVDQAFTVEHDRSHEQWKTDPGHASTEGDGA